MLPESIPDYLALVGDSADGFPGLPGWGAKSAGAVLARYLHLEDIPPAAGQWDVTVRGGAKLAVTLQDHLEDALLFRTLATLQPDAPVSATVDDMAWTGPTEAFGAAATASTVTISRRGPTACAGPAGTPDAPPGRPRTVVTLPGDPPGRRFPPCSRSCGVRAVGIR